MKNVIENAIKNGIPNTRTKVFKNIITYNAKENTENIKIFCDNVEEKLSFSQLPTEIYISTMTIICKINDMTFDCENIARYVDLSHDGIIDVVCAVGDKRKAGFEKQVIYRSLPTTNKTKKLKKVFYNQVSMHVKIKSKTDPIHIKLFKNGSIHMTGIQTDKNIVEILICIINNLLIDKCVLDSVTKQIVSKPFVSDKKYLDLIHISDLSVIMINSNYVATFAVNLENLHKLLVEKKVKCCYDKINHSCVNIKHYCSNKKISIFVFEKGSIVITGAQNGTQIKSAYDFIENILYFNYRKIMRRDLVDKT